MDWYRPHSLLDKVFEGGIIIKGLHAALELIAGLLLFFVSPASIQHFVRTITQDELLEDPHALFANWLIHAVQSLTNGSRLFLILYLWSHAVIKLVAVIGILRGKLWAYPFSLVVLGLFMVYQMYVVLSKGSIGMLLLTVFDGFIVWLIWREYGKVRATPNH